MTLRTVLWNLEWATPRSDRGRYLKSEIEAFDPDIICLTESVAEMLPTYGHAIFSDADYGYREHPAKRKVLLWSKEPWSEIDTTGSDTLPSGRYVSGTTQEVRFIGVCIPWSRAHVSTGRKDRRPWEDHLQYLAGLKEICEQRNDSSVPYSVLGDFNQTVPRSHQPARAYDALTELKVASDSTITTESVTDEKGNLLIDHVLIGNGLEYEIDRIHPTHSASNLRLSDHQGIFGTLRIN